jgi:hypothetical protein
MIGDLALLALASAWLSDRESGFLKSLRGAWSLLGTYIGIMIAWGLLFLPLLLIPFVIRRLAAASLDRNELNRLQGIVVGTVSQLLYFFSGPLMVERGQTFFQNVFRSLKMFIKHASLVVVLAALPIVLYLSVFLFDRESAPTLYGFLFLLSNTASFLMHALRLCAFRQVSDGSEPA